LGHCLRRRVGQQIFFVFWEILSELGRMIFCPVMYEQPKDILW
jgi:hypothetical protein